MVHRVRLVLGVAEVRLDRQSLELGDRGGFEAQWSQADQDISLEEYHHVVKMYLNNLYLKHHGKDAPGITLNLATHQLIEDIIGWSKLNYGSKPL